MNVVGSYNQADGAMVVESSDALGSPKVLQKSKFDHMTQDDALPSLKNKSEATNQAFHAIHGKKGRDDDNASPSAGPEPFDHAPQPPSGLGLEESPQEGPDIGPKLQFNSSDKKTKLMRAVFDYCFSVEKDLDSINTALGRDTARKDIRDQGPPKQSVPEQEHAIDSGNGVDVRLETKFFSCDGMFDSDGDFRHACEKEMASALQDSGPPPSVRADPRPVRPEKLPHPNHFNYTCSSELPYLIRVLCDSSRGNSRQKMVIGERPKAEEVDIIGFMVTSEPIADFFDKHLGVDAGPAKVLKFERPFRSVIRNIQHLRDHLATLSAENDHSRDETSTAAKESVHETCEIDSPQQSNDHKSSRPAFKKQQNKVNHSEAAAFGHFSHFIEFLDRYLAVKIGLFHDLKATKRDKVSFEDLWMLFDTGDTIYSPLRHGRTVVRNNKPPNSDSDSGSDSGEADNVHCTRRRYVPQAYRVLATIGGSPLRKTWAPRDIEMETESLMHEALLQIFRGRSPQISGLQSGFQPKQRIKERYSPLQIFCMYVDFDGLKYGTETDMFVFKPFDGEVKVKSLEAYPLRYAVSPRADYLHNRGRKFIDVTTSSTHMKHTGFAVGEIKEEVHGAVVVDTKLSFTEYQNEFPEDDMVKPAFAQFTKRFWPDVSGELNDLSASYGYNTCVHGPYCLGYDCVFDLYQRSQRDQLATLEPRIQEILEEADFFPHGQSDIERFKTYLEDQDLLELLPGVVPGFALRNRSWVQLDLDQLDFVEQEDEWKHLTLPKGHKQIVQAMVEMHSSGSDSPVDDRPDSIEMDLVRGKGKGCIILLHGVPGVGKTSTAECVASYTKRPLYSITCGDVGYEPEDVERNMSRHFKLAHRWGCVLLLDEADVFLAKRNKTDVKRNGLVSSFLRILEYYSGILFLTTNRVGAIDDAFRSRLHLTLYYPKLTGTQTMRIWKTNLQRLKEINKERLEAGRKPIDFNAKKLIDWVSDYWEVMQWNGRQIRNAFQTAVALAEFKAKHINAQHPGSPSTRPVLEIKQFKLLAKASNQFNEYLLLTHGDDEDQRAMLDQVRATSSPSQRRAKNLNDEDVYDEEEDYGSLLDSEGQMNDVDSEGVSGSSDDDDSDNDSESQSYKYRKQEKRPGKTKARIVKEDRREKSKGKKR